MAAPAGLAAGLDGLAVAGLDGLAAAGLGGFAAWLAGLVEPAVFGVGALGVLGALGALGFEVCLGATGGAPAVAGLAAAGCPWGVDVAAGPVAEDVGGLGCADVAPGLDGAGVEGLTVAEGCGCGTGGALNVPVDAFVFCGGTGACGGRTSTDNVNVRFSAACKAPTFTTWRVTSSPRSLRIAMITKYSSGGSSGG